MMTSQTDELYSRPYYAACAIYAAGGSYEDAYKAAYDAILCIINSRTDQIKMMTPRTDELYLQSNYAGESYKDAYKTTYKAAYEDAYKAAYAIFVTGGSYEDALKAVRAVRAVCTKNMQKNHVWNPNNHCEWNDSKKQIVKTLMLIRTIDNNILTIMPNEIMFMLIQLCI